MTHELEELQTLITQARDEARTDRKKCWFEDNDEKNHFDGQIEAYSYCLQMIKNVNNG